MIGAAALAVDENESDRIRTVTRFAHEHDPTRLLVMVPPGKVTKAKKVLVELLAQGSGTSNPLELEREVSTHEHPNGAALLEVMTDEPCE